MSSQKKSVLLPGSFFEKDSQKKLDYLKSKNLDTVYVSDHSVNPADDKLAMYEIRHAVSSLQYYEDRNFNIGTAVLNINKRKIDNLITEYLNPFLDIEKFKLGLGVGDNKYQKNLPNYSNNIEDVISYLLENFDALKHDISEDTVKKIASLVQRINDLLPNISDRNGHLPEDDNLELVDKLMDNRPRITM